MGIHRSAAPCDRTGPPEVPCRVWGLWAFLRTPTSRIAAFRLGGSLPLGLRSNALFEPPDHDVDRSRGGSSVTSQLIVADVWGLQIYRCVRPVRTHARGPPVWLLASAAQVLLPPAGTVSVVDACATTVPAGSVKKTVRS